MKRFPMIRLVCSLLSLFAFGLLPSAGVTFAAARSTQSQAQPFHIHRGILTYHNGPVVAGTMNVYPIFWEPAGTHVNPNYNNLIIQYYNDVGGNKLYNVIQQYTANNGSPVTAAYINSWVDTTNAYPGPSLTNIDIQNEVNRAILANSWPTGLNNYFPVFTASGIGSVSGYCEYHSLENRGKPPVVLYSYQVYPDGSYKANCDNPGGVSPNNCLVCDSAINYAAHAQFEVATDPVVGNGWFWQYIDHEVADECDQRFGTLGLDGGLANQQWNGHFYALQMMWSNTQAQQQKNGCTQG